jgi:A/G-specific adenine glycosylase
MIDDLAREAFQATVWNYFQEHGRHDLPWRQPSPDGSFDPYVILVSELMLQQTQVARVKPKYQEFLRTFPTVVTLARADQAEVLRAWSGLGYNRRARFLHQAAKQVTEKYRGKFPDTAEELVKLPGIGPNTAGALLAYAYNQPAAFLETNIRTVYIHHFFNDQADIADKELLNLVAETIDHEHPREWYWALMDYGTYLKATVGNLNRQSRSYSRQSAFQGSLRQIRGQVLKLLGEQSMTPAGLAKQINDARLTKVVDDLLAEELIHHAGEYLSL